MNNFNQLCADCLEPGGKHSLGSWDPDGAGVKEEWEMRLPERAGGTNTDVQVYYLEKNSGRKDRIKPWLGKSRYHEQLEMLRTCKHKHASTQSASDERESLARTESDRDGGDSVRLDGILEQAVQLYCADINRALQLGLVVWLCSALLAALLALWAPRAMLVAAAVTGYMAAGKAGQLFPYAGPLQWLVHFLVATKVEAVVASPEPTAAARE